MISAGHFLMFFIGLETASIPMAALVAFDKYRHHSAEAGAKYILTALFSSGLLLYGLSLIYGTVGTLYFADIPARLTGDPLQIMAFVFFFSGMGFKISLVPFHLWTADVYEGAPSTVTAYLSVISKGSAAFVLMTILIKVFAPMVAQWQEVLYWIIIASITLANLFALRQQNLKRLMAFSSISQAGYIMLGIISGTSQGMTSLVFYVLIYMFANLSVFTVITIVALRAHKFTLDDYNGLYNTNPKLAFLMTLALFSLAGIPPFAGFFSKFFIFAAAFEGGFHLLVFIALINTIISLYYYLKIVKAMYINKSDEPIAAFRYPTYGSNQKITGYSVSNNLELKVSDFDLIPRLIARASQVGANEVHGVRFTNEHADTLRSNLIKQAVYNGRQTAQAVAEATGHRLGDVKSITVAGNSPSYAGMQLMSLRAAAKDEATPVEPGTNTLSESVEVVYYLQ